MTGQELALRSALPPELVAAGVEIETDEQGGYRRVVFPDGITERFNVLLPVSEIARTDPNYTPAIRAAKLDVEQHTYEDSNAPKGTRSLNKLGLFALARVAGLGVPQTRRLPAAELGEGKIGWQATVVMRRSDGTPEPITASKIVDLEVEREKVAQGVRRIAGKSEQELRAIFERRWLYEREHMESKCETKAVERAIRAALQIPHSFRAQDLAKPFLVVGYSFTPDTSDPEVRRLVIEAGLSAERRLYGDGSARPRGELAAPPTWAVAAPDAGGAPDPHVVASEEGAPAGDTEPDFAAPDLAAEAVEAERIAQALREAQAAGMYRLDFGQYKGLTIDEIVRDRGDAGYVRYIATARANNDRARAAQAAARVYAAAFLSGEGERQ